MIGVSLSAPPTEKETPSVRIAPQLKTRAMRAAQAKHPRFNSLVTTLLEDAVHEMEEQALFRAFTGLGGD